MRKVYQKELFARRCVVQAIYQQSVNPSENLVEEFYKDIEINDELFEKILNRVLNEWDVFEWKIQDIISKESFEALTLSAKAVLRAAVSEVEMDKKNFSIIINDYLEVAKMFCDKEKSYLNKLIDSFFKHLS